MITIGSLFRREAMPGRCANCRHFDNRPSQVEAVLPGLNSFGSAISAVRSADGDCSRTGRYLSSERYCDDFSVRAVGSNVAFENGPA